MNAEAYTWTYFGLSTESECNSNITFFPLQDPLALDEGRTNTRPLDIPVCSHYPQVGSEACHSHCYQSLHSAIWTIDEAAEITLPETHISDIHGVSPVTTHPRLSETDSLCQRMVSWFNPSTLRGSKGSWPTSVTSSANEDPKDNIFVGVDTICNWHREGVSMNTLDYSYHTHDHTKSDFSVPSAVPILSHAPPYQEQGESRDQLKQCYKIGKDPATVSESSRSSRRPGGRRGARQGRYWCSICQLNYAQQQGLTRHYRDAHEVSLCTYCSDFKWHRRHQLKKHLEEQHTNVDISAALSEATKSRRKATKIKTSPRRGRAFPAIEHDRCGCVEPPPRRSMPPAVAELSPVSLPNMLFMDNDPQPDSAGPTVKRLKYARIAFPTTKERAPQTDPTVSARSVAICNKGQPVGPGGCTTIAHPSNEDPALHLTPAPLDILDWPSPSRGP